MSHVTHFPPAPSQVLTEISPATGRMTFRGKVMNRAARIASKATSGKVWKPGFGF